MALSRRTLLLSGAAAGAAGHDLAAGRRGRAPPRPAAQPTRSPSASPPATRSRTASCSGPGSRPTPLADGRPGRHAGPRRRRCSWELAADERFRRVVRRGRRRSPGRDAAHTVHVELNGLLPGREYFYRFQAERLRLAGRPDPHRARRPGPRGGTPGHVVRVLLAVRARLLHRLPAAGRGRARADPAPRRLPVRVRRPAPTTSPAATRATTRARRP